MTVVIIIVAVLGILVGAFFIKKKMYDTKLDKGANKQSLGIVRDEFNCFDWDRDAKVNTGLPSALRIEKRSLLFNNISAAKISDTLTLDFIGIGKRSPDNGEMANNAAAKTQIIQTDINFNEYFKGKQGYSVTGNVNFILHRL